MTINIRLANTTKELDSVFLLRHLVFAEQEGLLKTNEEKRFYDKFDAFPSSVQMIAQHL